MRNALVALLPLLVGLPAAAQNLDLTQGGPIEITAQDGIEWRQQELVVIARGAARALREGVAVDADRLIARYRPRGGAAAPPPPGSATSPVAGSEIWRLEAEGRVRITSATERAFGERAVYDLDQAVMVLSGQGLALETPDQRITARDSLEYWPQRRMAVARGGAVVVTSDNRRIAADTLVAHFAEPPPAGQPAARPTPSPTAQPARPAGLPGAPETSRIERVEAFGTVEIRTEEEVVRGDRGAYSPQTGLATLAGAVRITRGDNQLNGQEAIVDLRSGVSRLVSAPGQRVQGLIVPDQTAPRDAAVQPAGRPQSQAPSQSPSQSPAQPRPPQPRQPQPPAQPGAPR